MKFGRLSPKRFSVKEHLDLSHCSYHFRQLEGAGCIAEVESRPQGGAIEHIFDLQKAALAWTREWETLSRMRKQAVRDSALGRAVQALGAAIDSGRFEAYDESHLSWNSVYVDERAWIEMAAHYESALELVHEVEEGSLERIDRGTPFITMSRFMSTFESPRRDDPLRDVHVQLVDQPGELQPTADEYRSRRRAMKRALEPDQRMAKALSHPTRVRILMSMNTPRRRLSPSVFSAETGLELYHCAYHFKELEDFGCISHVATRPGKGGGERIFEAHRTALQWTEDWKRLGPAVKQTMLASVARGAVDAIGAAVEEGTFARQSDSHLSMNTSRVDLRGWYEIAGIYDELLRDLFRIDKQAMKRISDGAPYFVASYFMATFESPVQPVIPR